MPSNVSDQDGVTTTGRLVKPCSQLLVSNTGGSMSGLDGVPGLTDLSVQLERRAKNRFVEWISVERRAATHELSRI